MLLLLLFAGRNAGKVCALYILSHGRRRTRIGPIQLDAGKKGGVDVSGAGGNVALSL